MEIFIGGLINLILCIVLISMIEKQRNKDE